MTSEAAPLPQSAMEWLRKFTKRSVKEELTFDDTAMMVLYQHYAVQLPGLQQAIEAGISGFTVAQFRDIHKNISPFSVANLPISDELYVHILGWEIYSIEELHTELPDLLASDKLKEPELSELQDAIVKWFYPWSSNTPPAF